MRTGGTCNYAGFFLALAHVSFGHTHLGLSCAVSLLLLLVLLARLLLSHLPTATSPHSRGRETPHPPTTLAAFGLQRPGWAGGWAGLPVCRRQEMPNRNSQHLRGQCVTEMVGLIRLKRGFEGWPTREFKQIPLPRAGRGCCNPPALLATIGEQQQQVRPRCRPCLTPVPVVSCSGGYRSGLPTLRRHAGSCRHDSQYAALLHRWRD